MSEHMKMVPANVSFHDGLPTPAEVVAQIQRETAPRVAARLSFRPTLRPREVCSWCGRVLAEGDPGAPVTHGICSRPECRDKFKGVSR